MGVSRKELSEVAGEVEIGGAVAGSVDEQQLFARVLFDRLGQAADGLDLLKADAENGRVGAELFTAGDAMAVKGKDMGGAPLRDSVAHGELGQNGGFTHAGRAD